MTLRGWEADLRARLRRGAAGERILSREGQHPSRQAPGRPGHLPVLRRLEPDGSRGDTRAALRFVGEEPEQLVLQNRSADAAPFLIELIGIAPHRARRSRSIPFLERVELWPVRLEEGAAADLIGAVLGNDHDLRAARPAVLSAVVARDDADFLDGLFAGRQHRRSAPRHAVHSHPVDLDEIRVRPRAVRGHLRSIFDEEDAVGAAGRRSVGARHRRRPTIGDLSAVAERARRESYGLERIAAEGRQILHVSGGQSGADRRRLGLEQRDTRLSHGDRIRDAANLQLHDEGSRLLRRDLHVFEGLLRETVPLHREPVRPGSEGGKHVHATRAGRRGVRDVGFVIGERDGRIGHRRAGGIGDDTLDAAAKLRLGRGRAERQHRKGTCERSSSHLGREYRSSPSTPSRRGRGTLDRQTRGGRAPHGASVRACRR